MDRKNKKFGFNFESIYNLKMGLGLVWVLLDSSMIY